MSAMIVPASLAMLLRALKLPTVARHAEEIARLAERDGWTFERYLHHLVELEVHERRRRRIERYLKESELPREKTLATLTRSRLPTKVATMLPTLCDGAFIERGDNLLAFGLPGRGKTHLVCAIGHELIQRGHRVLFTATYALVQRLLAAKRDLRLEKELAILDGFDAVICDDIGYVQQNRDEMEVLFTFLAERYERRTELTRRTRSAVMNAIRQTLFDAHHMDSVATAPSRRSPPGSLHCWRLRAWPRRVPRDRSL